MIITCLSCLKVHWKAIKIFHWDRTNNTFKNIFLFFETVIPKIIKRIHIELTRNECV